MLRTKNICRFAFIFISCLLILALWTVSAQAVLSKMDLSELVDGADALIVGTVLSKTSEWNHDRSSIITTVTIAVEESIKGEQVPEEVMVVVQGGEIDGIGQAVSDMPEFSIGERTLLFLQTPLAEDGGMVGQGVSGFSLPLFKVYGGFQGKLRVTADESADTTLAKAFSSTSGDVLVGSSPFVLSGQKWPGSSPVVAYKINDIGGPPGSRQAVQNAAATWNSAGANFSFVYTGTHSRSGAEERNSINEVTWNNMGVGSTLARASWWYYISTNEIFEVDMVFNTAHSWSAGLPIATGSYHVETVALHEFGHWLSLDHSQEAYQSVMWWQYLGYQPVLFSDDISAIKALYGPASHFTYEVTSGKAEITGYSMAGPRDVVIPSSLGGYPVTSIGASAFNNCQLMSVNIPNSVVSIGDYAFSSNQLTSLSIPPSVSNIGTAAFASNKLVSVTIPASVTSLGLGSFNNNKLASVFILSSTTSLGDFAFGSNQQNPADLTIYGLVGSTAQAYAEDYRYNFKTLLVDRVVAEPAAGEVPGGTQVSLRCTTNGATIYYTADGTTPTANSPVYTFPLTLIDDITIKAIALKHPMVPSEVFEARYGVYYTVSFRDHDGSLLSKQFLKYGRDAAPPSAPERTGFQFVGWDDLYTNVTAHLDITAQYTVCQFTVTYDSRGGSPVNSFLADYASFTRIVTL